MKHIILSIIGIALIALGIALYLKPKEIIVEDKRPTKYEIVKFCQELSAYTVNDDWGYKSCLEELEKGLQGKDLKMLNTI